MNPPSQIKSLFPILNNPAKRHRAAGFTKEQFHYAFTNTLSREDSDQVYDRYHIPAPGSWVWAYGLIANFKPGKQETWVDYDNDDRAPLLFITGGADHIMPASVNHSNAKHYKKSAALTEVYDFPGRSHWTCAEPGWEAGRRQGAGVGSRQRPGNPSCDHRECLRAQAQVGRACASLTSVVPPWSSRPTAGGCSRIRPSTSRARSTGSGGVRRRARPRVQRCPPNR